jgi:thiosulfate dehydrogenase [quinone] large subunit
MSLTAESLETVPSTTDDGVSAGESSPLRGNAAPSLPVTGQPWAGGPDHNLRLVDWLYRSHLASVIWLAVRLWLGYQWLNAGYQKIWGSEKSAFWFGGGAGVKGFASAAVAGSATGKGGASYGWWAAFLHNFVIPNASWIGKFVSLAEVLIGVALILGFLTGGAALGGLVLNIVYMFTGSAGVNPMYAILSVLLILAWRNAGWIGADRFVFSAASRWHRPGVESGTLRQRRSVASPRHSRGHPDRQTPPVLQDLASTSTTAQ